MSSIKTQMQYSISFYAYLAWQRNQLIAQKVEHFKEAMMWKEQKYGGRADICFELYGEVKDILAKGLPYFKQVGKNVGAKPVLGVDMMVDAIEYRGPAGWVTLAKDQKEIQRIGEDYIVESVLLGGDGEENRVKPENT